MTQNDNLASFYQIDTLCSIKFLKKLTKCMKKRLCMLSLTKLPHTKLDVQLIRMRLLLCNFSFPFCSILWSQPYNIKVIFKENKISPKLLYTELSCKLYYHDQN